MSADDLTLAEIADRLNDTLLSALAAGGSHGYGKPGKRFGYWWGRIERRPQ